MIQTDHLPPSPTGTYHVTKLATVRSPMFEAEVEVVLAEGLTADEVAARYGGRPDVNVYPDLTPDQ